MTEQTAQAISDLLMRATAAIDESVAVLKDSGAPAEELSDYKHAAASTLGTMFSELLVPLYRQHPSVMPPELKHGRD